MVRKEVYISTKQRMNMEQRAIDELIDKLCFLKMSDEEKLQHFEYIRSCRLRYLELERQLIMEKQADGKKIQNYLHISKGKYKNF